MPAPIVVELCPHSPQWAVIAREESRRLMAAVGPSLLGVHHIGSTAIPGIGAKPVIDLLPVVRLAAFDTRRAAVEELGYQWWDEYGLPGRRYCTWDDPATGRRTFQLHCFAEGDFQIKRHLAFRDYLRALPDEAAAYEREKIRCRDLFPDNSHAYSDAKAGWIESRLVQALERDRRLEDRLDDARFS